MVALEPIRFLWNQKRALSFCFIVRPEKPLALFPDAF